MKNSDLFSAIPPPYPFDAGFTAILPHVHEPHKKTVFQYSADVLIQNQRTPLLQAYLQFFLIPNPGFVDYGQEVLPGCAIGYVNFQHLNLFSEIYYLIDLTMINALINHGMPVDVNVLLKILNGDAPHKRQLVEAFFPVLPQCKVDSTETKKILNACIPGRHYDVMVYLHTQGVHFPSDVVAHIMKQQGKFTSLMQLKSLLSTSVDEHLKCAVKLREEGTAAYKEQDYLNARRCYRQALDKLSQAPAGVVKYTLLEERQKLLGNLSSVERHLKNYDGSISWAKSLVKNFPDNPKVNDMLLHTYLSSYFVYILILCTFTNLQLRMYLFLSCLVLSQLMCRVAYLQQVWGHGPGGKCTLHNQCAIVPSSSMYIRAYM